MEIQYSDYLATSRKSTSTERTLEVGVHLISERDGYTHHGIYAGNGQVIHYGGFRHSAKRHPIEYIPLHGFAAGKNITVLPEPDAVYTGMDAVDRARSRLGEDQYQLLTNNCEHFCTWCLLGVGRSEQVRSCLRNPWTAIKTLCALAREVMHAFRDHAKPTCQGSYGLGCAAYCGGPTGAHHDFS